MKTAILRLLSRLRVSLALLLAACASTPTIADHAEEAVTTASVHLQRVAEFLRAAIPVAQQALAIVAAAEGLEQAYDDEDYAAALKHARAGVEAVEAAGVDVPPEIKQRLVEAELLLGFLK